MNLPFPLIVITSFNFNCLESFVSFCPFIKTLSWLIICAALLLEVLAKSDTILSNRRDGTIILTSSTLISFFLISDISFINIVLFSNLVSEGNSFFNILAKSSRTTMSAPSFKTNISPTFSLFNPKFYYSS